MLIPAASHTLHTFLILLFLLSCLICMRTCMETPSVANSGRFLLGGGHLQQGVLLPWIFYISQLHTRFSVVSHVSTAIEPPLSHPFEVLEILLSTLHCIVY